jgi:hypothetical protein
LHDAGGRDSTEPDSGHTRARTRPTPRTGEITKRGMALVGMLLLAACSLLPAPCCLFLAACSLLLAACSCLACV